MQFNRAGKMDVGTVVVIAAILLVAAYATNFNGFKDYVGGMSGGSNSDDSGNVNDAMKLCPTDGTTTYTINVQDALALTATDVNANYYVFGNDGFVKSGSIAGSGTVDVSCGENYKLLLVNETVTTGAYAKTIDLQARKGDQSENVKLTRFGGAKILGIENPSDPARNANVTLGAGDTKAFSLKFAANVTQRGYSNPIILCQVNQTSISSVSLASFSDSTPVKTATVPKRIQASAGYLYYAWEYPKILDPSMGVIIASGSITAGSITPSTADSMSCLIVDQATYATSSYKTAKNVDEAFKVGAENAETQAAVGGPDSTAASYYYISAGGY